MAQTCALGEVRVKIDSVGKQCSVSSSVKDLVVLILTSVTRCLATESYYAPKNVRFRGIVSRVLEW